MKIKKIFVLFIVMVVVVFSIIAVFALRPRGTIKPLISQELAKLPQNPKPIAEFKRGEMGKSEIRSVTFSKDGRFLVSGGLVDKSGISLWDVFKEQHIKSLQHYFDGTRYTVNAVAASADGKRLASANKHVKLWNVNDIRSPVEEATLKHSNQVWTVDFSPDGKLLAAGDQSGEVKVWDIQRQKATTFRHDAAVYAVDFSPDGKLLAAGNGSGKVKVWGIQSKEDIKTLNGDPERVLAVRFSSKPDNPILAAAGQHGNIKLWNLSDWQLRGTIIYRPTVSGLAFSKDGKVLASAGEGLELWSVKTGAHIISLKGHTDWVTSAAFSSSSAALASGSDDGILRVWDTASYMTSQKLEARPRIRTIYFLPRGRHPQPYIRTKIDKLIKDVQKFYADEIERHGFGEKTFDFEKDENGKAVVYRLDGQFTDDHYLENTADNIRKEIYEQFDKRSRNVWLIVVDISSKKIGMVNALGGLISSSGNPSYAMAGHALIPAADNALNFRTLAHELGHAFGLDHDFREHDSSEGSYIMSYNYVPPYRLSKCAAEWLDKSCLFNQYRKFYDELPTIGRLPSITDPSSITTHLQFEVADADGLHQIQLSVPATDKDLREIVEDNLRSHPGKKRYLLEQRPDYIKYREDNDLEIEELLQDSNFWEEHIKREANQPALVTGVGLKLHSCQQINGRKTTTVEFELPDTSIKKVCLRIIDLLGNIAEQEFDFNTDATEPSEKP